MPVLGPVAYSAWTRSGFSLQRLRAKVADEALAKHASRVFPNT